MTTVVLTTVPQSPHHLQSDLNVPSGTLNHAILIPILHYHVIVYVVGANYFISRGLDDGAEWVPAVFTVVWSSIELSRLILCCETVSLLQCAVLWKAWYMKGLWRANILPWFLSRLTFTAQPQEARDLRLPEPLHLEMSCMVWRALYLFSMWWCGLTFVVEPSWEYRVHRWMSRCLNQVPGRMRLCMLQLRRL